MIILFNQLRRKGLVIIPLVFWLAGCAATSQVKHLSSDVCLVMPESTTQSEVLSFLGKPNKRSNTDTGEEIWVYYKEDKDTLRKLPLVGEHIGHHTYEIVTVTFIGTKVRTCVYRQLNPSEFTSFNLDHQLDIAE